MQGRRMGNPWTSSNIESRVVLFSSHRNFDVNSREFSKFLLLCENSACMRMLFIDRFARFFIRNYFKIICFPIFNSLFQFMLYLSCFLTHRFKIFHVLVTKMFAIVSKLRKLFILYISIKFFFLYSNVIVVSATIKINIDHQWNYRFQMKTFEFWN